MSGIFTYDDGERVPFDPRSLHFDGCILCGARAYVVGVFVPSTADMVAVVMKLRRHAMRPHSTSAIAYGLCIRCVTYPNVAEQVEQALEAAAARVVIQ